MNDQERDFSERQYMLFGVIFTLIALIALGSLVFVRSSAQNQATVTQQAFTHVVMPTIDSETLTQDQGGTEPVVVGYVGASDLPSNPTQVVLTSGSLSTPVILEVHFTDTNGVATAIKNANATVKVVAAYGSQQVTDCTTANLDGTSCWQTSFSGMDDRIQANSSSTGEYQGTLIVPSAFPNYAKPGIWSYYIEVTPVDETGAAAPTYKMTNAGEANLLRASFGKLVAIEVSPAIVNYYKNGQSLAPRDISDAEPITIQSQGNVVSYVSIYGDAAGWSCDSGQTMSVDVTRFKGGTGLVYTSSDAQVLAGGNANRKRITDGATDWMVPVSTGTQDEVLNVQGQNSFETMIAVPIVVGTCTTTATVLGEDASL